MSEEEALIRIDLLTCIDYDVLTCKRTLGGIMGALKRTADTMRGKGCDIPNACKLFKALTEQKHKSETVLCEE